MIAYCLYWNLTNMSLFDLISNCTYLLYCSVAIGCFVVAAGTISVQSSYLFIKMMYSNEKSV